MTIGYAFRAGRTFTASKGKKNQQSKKFVPRIGPSPAFKAALEKATKQGKEPKQND